ncbi:MAG: hypothetical protein HC831_03240 [Chloroflexia bacterium]|nr:hypothetical protein [Chloroflexia bacterium]
MNINQLASKLLILFVSIFLFGGHINSQPWMNNVSTQKGQGEQPNFYDIQNAFNNYWKNKKITKGKGYKQFKHWEAFMLPRVYPNGYFLLLKVGWNKKK